MGAGMINGLIRYFDLQSGQRPDVAKGQAGEVGKPAYAPVLPQYGALALGVLVQPLLDRYVQSGDVAGAFHNFWVRVVGSGVIAIVILPGVYKNAFDPTRPLLVQLAALFTSGVGWQALFGSAIKATGR
ncbi:MAG: hypothetical protein P4L73_08815 [Caulobacteraceae bacterium]|nr:hypothetical protein [Caulobacteraceae bacterium]